MKCLLTTFTGSSGKKFWRPEIPIIAAVDWSPPEIKKEVEWNIFTRYFFYENDRNRIEVYPHFYAADTFGK